MNHPSLVRRNLRHWTLHVLLSAAGSFALALATEWRKPQSIIGMLAGIIVFIGAYTAIWSRAWFQRRVSVDGILLKAFLYGTRLRSGLGVLGCVSMIFATQLKSHAGVFIVFALPDWIAAFLLGIFVDSLGRSPGVRWLRVAVGGADAHLRGQNLWVGDVNSLVPSFLITLAQGFLLSVMLLALSAICLPIIRWQATRKSADQLDMIASTPAI